MKVLLKIDSSEATGKFSLLKTLFENSEFEVALIKQKRESMSGKTVAQSWIQIEKKNE